MGYLLKPFSAGRLAEALARAGRQVGRPGDPGLERAAAKARPSGVPVARLRDLLQGFRENL